MPVTSSIPSAQSASTTSSGIADGLGRRALAFDREEGTMLERLVLRPELGAFENMLRERLDRVAALEDERIARPRTIERDADGSIVVVSEFVPGSRLSELLDISADLGTAPGVDAALGFMLDVLPALCGLHAGAGFAHGTIAASRTVLTPAGQIVLLDAIYGGALGHLRYGRRKLWTDFSVAVRPSAGAPRLDVEADIAQTALAAVMLVLGRPLRDVEYASGLPTVVGEVVEVAQIRASAAFAAGLQEFLERALPVAHPNPYTSADDALFDVRQIAGELGANGCRRALIEFIEQMESSGQATGRSAAEEVLADIDHFLAETSPLEFSPPEPEQDLESGVDAEINLDGLAEESPYDLNDVTDIEVQSEPAPEEDDDLVLTESVVASIADLPAPAADVETLFDGPSQVEMRPAHPIPLSTVFSVPETPVAAPAHSEIPTLAEAADVVATPELSPEAGDAIEDPDSQADVPSVRSRRAKRQTKSVRARKDKLRSLLSWNKEPAVQPVKAAEETPPPVAPEPEPVVEKKEKKSGGWLVAPDRAAAFEPAVPEPLPMPAAVPPPRPVQIGEPLPPVPLYQPPSLPQPAPITTTPIPIVSAPMPAQEPVFSRTVAAPVPPVAPSYQPLPPVSQPATQTQNTPMISVATPQLVSVKLKQEPKRPRAPRPVDTAADIYAPAPPAAAGTTPESPGGFPWKLAAAAVLVMVAAIVGGRVYLPAKGVPSEDSADAAPAQAPATTTTPAAVTAATGPTGRLEIETQPAGARILIDGKPAGESPLALDGVSAGRHVVTFVSSSGSVRRTVRIEAGRTAKLDVPIFSGWVGIYAPFVLDVSEAGQVIGTTEEPRLMISPGKHVLTLTNRELGYVSVQTVEVEPGEERAIRLDPQGKVNLNATPWAEVWIDGRKAGDTPLANLQMPLGIREVIFRHPQLGERRVTVTVKANAPAAISVDMNKPGND